MPYTSFDFSKIRNCHLGTWWHNCGPICAGNMNVSRRCTLNWHFHKYAQVCIQWGRFLENSNVLFIHLTVYFLKLVETPQIWGPSGGIWGLYFCFRWRESQATSEASVRNCIFIVIRNVLFFYEELNMSASPFLGRLALLLLLGVFCSISSNVNFWHWFQWFSLLHPSRYVLVWWRSVCIQDFV